MPADNLPQSKKTIIVTSVFILLASSLIIARIFSHQQKQQKNLVEKLRSEIKKELQTELTPKIEEFVKIEVKKMYENEMAKNVEGAVANFKLSLNSENFESEETLKAAITRAVEEAYQSQVRAKIVSDAMLDEEVAGIGIEPNTVIQGGFVKPLQLDPEFELAQANTATTSTENNMSVADNTTQRAESIERTMVQKGSVLLPKGKLVFEPSFTYAHFSTNRINIQGVTILEVFTIGPVSTESIRRDMFIQTLGFKYGLLNNLQGEIRIPTRYEFDRITSTNQTSENTRDKFGIGDVDLSISRQVGWEHGLMPDLIASLGVKTISGEPIYNNAIGLGSGHWSVRSSLIAAKSSDPAVVFGSLSYIHSFERNFTNFGDVKPGDTYAYSVGLAIALSYQTAINFSFDQSITQKLTRNGQKVVGSFVNSANFKTGFNWAFNERSSVDFSVAIGLTNDSPDVTVEVRFPFSF